MSQEKPFLTAYWSDLILVSYAVHDQSLEPYLAPGLELDRWKGLAYVSLVAFSFLKTRVLGATAPFPSTLRDFSEVNLRFYVRQGDRRGVVFLRELVPNLLVAKTARLLYNEPYDVAPMTHRVTQVGDLRRVRHDLRVNNLPQTIAVSARGPAEFPEPDGIIPFLIEQSCGFGRMRDGRLTRYQVHHPRWRVYSVETLDLNLDYGLLYGSQWQFLNDQTPDSLILAEGSQAEVYPNELRGQRIIASANCPTLLSHQCGVLNRRLCSDTARLHHANLALPPFV